MEENINKDMDKNSDVIMDDTDGKNTEQTVANNEATTDAKPEPIINQPAKSSSGKILRYSLLAFVAIIFLALGLCVSIANKSGDIIKNAIIAACADEGIKCNIQDADYGFISNTLKLNKVDFFFNKQLNEHLKNAKEVHFGSAELKGFNRMGILLYSLSDANSGTSSDNAPWYTKILIQNADQSDLDKFKVEDAIFVNCTSLDAKSNKLFAANRIHISDIRIPFDKSQQGTSNSSKNKENALYKSPTAGEGFRTTLLDAMDCFKRCTIEVPTFYSMNTQDPIKADNMIIEGKRGGKHDMILAFKKLRLNVNKSNELAMLSSMGYKDLFADNVFAIDFLTPTGDQIKLASSLSLYDMFTIASSGILNLDKVPTTTMSKDPLQYLGIKDASISFTDNGFAMHAAKIAKTMFGIKNIESILPQLQLVLWDALPSDKRTPQMRKNLNEVMNFVTRPNKITAVFHSENNIKLINLLDKLADGVIVSSVPGSKKLSDMIK